MRIAAQVKSNQRQNKIIWAGDKLLISVTAPAIEGQANKRVVELVAGSMGVAKSLISIAKGHTSPYKTLAIDLERKDLESRLNKLEHAKFSLTMRQSR